MSAGNADWLTALQQVYGDGGLSATDKAAWTVCRLYATATGLYYFGVSHLARVLRVTWRTADQSLGRLRDRGWLTLITPHPHPVYAVHDTPRPTQKDPAPLRADTPIQEAPRMAMPPTTAAEIVRLIDDQQRLVSAVLMADMVGITPEERHRWLVELDRLTDLRETFTAWLADHPPAP